MFSKKTTRKSHLEFYRKNNDIILTPDPADWRAEDGVPERLLAVMKKGTFSLDLSGKQALCYNIFMLEERGKVYLREALGKLHSYPSEVPENLSLSTKQSTAEQSTSEESISTQQSSWKKWSDVYEKIYPSRDKHWIITDTLHKDTAPNASHTSHLQAQHAVSLAKAAIDASSSSFASPPAPAYPSANAPLPITPTPVAHTPPHNPVVPTPLPTQSLSSSSSKDTASSNVLQPGQTQTQNGALSTKASTNASPPNAVATAGSQSQRPPHTTTPHEPYGSAVIMAQSSVDLSGASWNMSKASHHEPANLAAPSSQLPEDPPPSEPVKGRRSWIQRAVTAVKKVILGSKSQ